VQITAFRVPFDTRLGSRSVYPFVVGRNTGNEPHRISHRLTSGCSRTITTHVPGFPGPICH